MLREFLFVYGTLTRRIDHPLGLLVQRHATCRGEGRMRARLYLIPDPEEPGNAYPGAVPSGYDEDIVFGEIFEVHAPEALFPELDRYEACSPERPEPHEFVRRRVPVTMEEKGLLLCWSYLYAWDVARARHVPSGRVEDAEEAIVEAGPQLARVR